MTTVTPATADDIDAIATLLEELDRFYGAADFEPHGLRTQQIKEALFGDLPAAYALLAWNEERPVGFASYSFLWPAAGVTLVATMRLSPKCRGARSRSAKHWDHR